MRPTFLLLVLAATGLLARDPAPRPPSAPLIVHDPYLSLWSPGGRLAATDTRHWANGLQRLTGLIRVDGRAYRVLGAHPADLPTLAQTSVEVLPTRTIARFTGAGLRLSLTFLTPALPDDLDVLARPLSYVIWEASSADRKVHAVQVCLQLGDELVLDGGNRPVTVSRLDAKGCIAAQMGARNQTPLGATGDEVGIDWGMACLAAPASAGTTLVHGEALDLVRTFASTGKLPPAAGEPRDGALTLCQSLGSVKAAATCFQMVALDEVASLRYMGSDLRPLWKRAGLELPGLVARAAQDLPDLRKRCQAFDRDLLEDATRIGGPRYADLCALAYRQCLGACGLAADAKGAPLMMPKENSSNGCIATVDVHFPMLPEFLLFFPTLAKATLVPPMDYAASRSWPYPYAPHDLGTYPRADGQVYGMDGPDADRMPVEESGNLILMLGAISHLEGNADFASRWWPQLTAWAGYLERQGFDPANQLCTDDFAGHLAHNANLSVKAILALGAYGSMAGLRGETGTARHYQDLARDAAKRWMVAADDGDHSRLAFDKPGTWSQKYNLVWDRILGLDIFPPSVAEREMAFYRKHFGRFGLPLDSRGPQAKADWEIWSASLTGRREDLEAFVAPLWDFYGQVPEERPMTDWYDTRRGRMIGFTARSVVGGIFLPFLYHPDLWRKWARRDKADPATHVWADIPVPGPSR